MASDFVAFGLHQGDVSWTMASRWRYARLGRAECRAWLGRGPALLALLVVAIACASPAEPGAPADPESTARNACPDGTRYIFSQDDAVDGDGAPLFAIFDATASASGEVFVSYDADTPQAGDDRLSTTQRLVEVDAEGSVRDVELPILDGTPLPESLVPLVGGPDGTTYFYDFGHSRVVARDGNQQWRNVASIANSLVYKAPLAAIGPDGSLYLATASEVFVLGDDAQLTRLAGLGPIDAGDISYPQQLPTLPAMALDATLPSPTALLVDDAGGIYLATAGTLYYIVNELLTVALAGAGVIELPNSAAGPPNVTGLAINEGGQLLVSDSGNQQLLIVTTVSTEVVLTGVRFISDGVVLARPGSPSLLAVDSEQKMVCAL